MDSTINTLRSSSKRAIAGQLARLETDQGLLQSASLLDEAQSSRMAHVIGVTGPPGAGKSTAINLLVQALRGNQRRVAVVAIDPSSRRTGGAILGDRNRFELDPADPGIFVRSLAARTQLGGLAEAAIGAVVLLAAIFDHVIVETVGVGQSETDIAALADTVIVAVQPASGDSLQFMKAGIMEIPDILAITKADLGQIAERAARDMAMAARAQIKGGGWETRVLKLASTQPKDKSGMAELVAEIERHFFYLQENHLLSRQRMDQLKIWQERLIGSWFGRKGLEIIGEIPAGAKPFTQLAEIHERLSIALHSTKA